MIRYLNKTTGTCNNLTDKIDSSFMIEIPDDGNEYSYDDKTGNIKNLSDTDEFKKDLRLKEIENLLLEIDTVYATIVLTPIKYENNLYYQPRYVQDYFNLALTGMPQIIWDYSELNGIEMTSSEINSLALFLKDVAEPAFQKRKNDRKPLILEKLALLGKSS